ncbi:MAG TPA: G8 domain-containing protein [Candidatus Limnocylindrales bacterium]|nr:G8 domain-containing protein [Candidatus Limnocylindrales bacterium]
MLDRRIHGVLCAALLVALWCSAATAATSACEAAIARSGARYLDGRSRVLAACRDRALASGNAVAAAECEGDAAVVSALDEFEERARATIAHACGGDDQTCGGSDDVPLSATGWEEGACPGLAGAGCNGAIADCTGIADCVTCSLDAVGTPAADSLADDAGEALLRCQRTLVSSVDRYLRASARALQKCQAAVASGIAAGPCPTPGDGRAEPRLTKARAKLVRNVCKSCGGGDRRCDVDVLGIAGSGADDDFTAATIGFSPDCSDVAPPSTGQSCARSVSTLGDIAECVQCTAQFGAECASLLALPAAGEYPQACRGGDCPQCLRWSDPATWGGAKPAPGEEVVIPQGTSILLDEDTPDLGGLTIDGSLVFDRTDLSLTADWIMVHGELRVGTEDRPFEQQAIITLDAADPDASVMGMGTRGIMVMGGALELHGRPPQVAWTRLAAHAPGGATVLQLEEDPGWSAGDQIVVAPTDWFGASATESFTIAAAAATSVELNAPLSAPRWGLLQYATADGMSLSPAGLVTPPAAPTPVVLDERAEVANLTRNIVIQAPDDALWQTQGFGAHVMIMGTGAQAHVSGVQIRRGGQRGRLGRYPFHWHRLSYSSTTFVGDASGQYIRDSSIHQSANRGIVIHATNGVVVQNNVLYDIRGHAVFTEDAVERRNTIAGNLTLHVRNPLEGDALKLHEIREDGGSSGYWIANPDNVVTGNTAADSQGHGFWLAFPNQPHGDSSGVPMRPSRMLFGVFEDNTAHTSGFEGLMFDRVESDDAGTTIDFQYQSTTDGQDPTWNSNTLRRFAITRFTAWKNRRGGIWDRVAWPDFTEIVSADNCGRFFAGSGADGVIERSLIVGTSLNAATPRPSVHFPDTLGGNETPTAFATYHSAFDMRRNVIVGFPLVPGTRSGAFATEDYYIRPVDKGQMRNFDNLLIQSHPGFRSLPVLSHYVLAGALWDPHGSWGPAGSYFVYDTPFFTYGQTVTPVEPAGQTGGVSVPGPFYGVLEFVVNNDRPYYSPLMAIEATRLDPMTLTEVAAWSVDEALDESWLLAPMRHFAAHRDGIYRLEFPSSPMPQDIELRFENMLEITDTLVLAVQFDGETTPEAVWTLGSGGFRLYEQQASLAAVMASAGEAWWQDADNDLVWVKLRGGSWQFWDQSGQLAAPTSDELLYETTVLHIDTD